MTDQRHYAPIIIRSAMPTPKERKFLASIIKAENQGRALTQRQADWLGALVRRFQRETMRDESGDGNWQQVGAVADNLIEKACQRD